MNARRLPGVRCSTLNTECRSLLCLIIIPGRSWVAGIAIGGNALLLGSAACLSGANQQETDSRHQCYGPEINILYGSRPFGNPDGKHTAICWLGETAQRRSEESKAYNTHCEVHICEKADMNRIRAAEWAQPLHSC